MLEITLPVVLTGFLASVLTEVGKLFPVVKNNKLVNSLLAIVLCFLGGVIIVGKVDLTTTLSVIGWAFINYKLLVQPAVEQVGK